MNHIQRLPRGRRHARPAGITILALTVCLGFPAPSTHAESEDRGKNGKLRLRFSDIDNEGPVNREGWHFARRSADWDRPGSSLWNSPIRIELILPFRFRSHAPGRAR
ncbi:MAG: hypothetical protein CMJ51_05250 [Planctomycetaceae bacterium]|nr:hypothetical protein [Planctomycetaceae bacterium]